MLIDMQHEPDTLCFVICGGAGDGKSTLIGRLLRKSGTFYEDHPAALIPDSKQYSTQGQALDSSLSVDGLQSEREQQGTIDIAYRFFATERRRFIVADTPGHEQYTNNMAIRASSAHLAVLLIDPRKGVPTQTKRHSRILCMLGIRHVVVAVNKMDLIEWDKQKYEKVKAAYRAFADDLDFSTVEFIPISALDGDNVVSRSSRSPWHEGPPLLRYLENVCVDASSTKPFRFSVQWVNRSDPDFPGYCGRIASGEVRTRDPIRVHPSGAVGSMKSIVTFDGKLGHAVAGQSVTLTLNEKIDASRGDVFASAGSPVEVADQFEVQLLWMSPHPMIAGRPYTAKIHNQWVGATVTQIKHRVDVDSGAHLAAKSLAMNEIGTVNVGFDRAVAFEPCAENRTLGSFILVDRLTQETLAAGIINFALRRSANIHWQAIDVDKQARSNIKNQEPCCIWLTGLSGSGKSTIANLLDKRLHASNLHTFVLDGDNVRHRLNRDLGFTEADRAENIRRVAEVARLMVDAGLIVIVSFISPYRAERAFARSLFDPGEFIEVFVDTPLSICEERDPKGLYAKARAGKLPNMTGYDSPYEPPEAPEVTVKTTECTPEEATEPLAALALSRSSIAPSRMTRMA
jgi:bifunctional enzyme CysN/CysC